RRWCVVEADDRRKWRLVAGLRALSFERFEKRRLLARFIGAGAPVHEHIALESGPQYVLAEKTTVVRVGDRPFEDMLNVQELAADVNVGDFRANRITADGASLDQEMRIALHQQVILESARLAFVGVAGDVTG